MVSRPGFARGQRRRTLNVANVNNLRARPPQGNSGSVREDAKPSELLLRGLTDMAGAGGRRVMAGGEEDERVDASTRCERGNESRAPGPKSSGNSSIACAPDGGAHDACSRATDALSTSSSPLPPPSPSRPFSRLMQPYAKKVRRSRSCSPVSDFLADDYLPTSSFPLRPARARTPGRLGLRHRPVGRRRLPRPQPASANPDGGLPQAREGPSPSPVVLAAQLVRESWPGLDEMPKPRRAGGLTLRARPLALIAPSSLSPASRPLCCCLLADSVRRRLQLPIYPAPQPEIVLVETSSDLESHIAVAREQTTSVFRSVRDETQKVVSKWIAIERRVAGPSRLECLFRFRLDH
jgi:hypothetical protein